MIVAGSPVATITLEAVERLRVRSGVAFEGGLATAVERESRMLAAFDRALNMLALRGRSERDLRRRLVQKGETEEAADDAIARLAALGLLNDADFAKQFARSKVLGPGHSKRRLQQELFRAGVSREVADGAIAGALADDDVNEAEIIERVARKKLRTLARLDAATSRRRLYAFLARRGYDSAAIRDTIARLMSADDAEALSGEGATG
ncbi:MAG: regulatory protein RecX [Gemmatimonadaceae bacterium]